MKYLYTEETGTFSNLKDIYVYELDTPAYRTLGSKTWAYLKEGVWSRERIQRQQLFSVKILGEFDSENNPIEILYG